MRKLIQEWENCDKIKVFEFEVINKRTGEADWVTFDISIVDDHFTAQHEPLNEEQRESNLISFVEIDLDYDFSLDENLQELHEACQEALNDSTFFCDKETWEREQLEENCHIFKLPAFWAISLINGDQSGYTDQEILEISKFVDDNGLGYCVGCSEESFFQHSNDANNIGSDCLEFYFHKEK